LDKTVHVNFPKGEDSGPVEIQVTLNGKSLTPELIYPIASVFAKVDCKSAEYAKKEMALRMGDVIKDIDQLKPITLGGRFTLGGTRHVVAPLQYKFSEPQDFSEFVITANDLVGDVHNAVIDIQIDGEPFTTYRHRVGNSFRGLPKNAFPGGRTFVEHKVQPIGREYVTGSLVQIFSRDDGNWGGSEEMIISKILITHRKSCSR
jgi:hypothetical protein